MDSCAEAARARDEFDQLQISFSPSGFLYLIPTLHVRTRTTGPARMSSRELATDPPPLNQSQNVGLTFRNDWSSGCWAKSASSRRTDSSRASRHVRLVPTAI